VSSVRTLALGQAALFNVDDSIVVVIGRDDSGMYAMSGICTHQCCLVALCANRLRRAWGSILRVRNHPSETPVRRCRQFAMWRDDEVPSHGPWPSVS